MAALVRKNPNALDDLAGRVDDNHKLKVGFLQGATYPDGTSVPEVAGYNEFGVASRGQPARPFFRRTIAANAPSKWPRMAAAVMKQNGLDVAKTLDIMGQVIVGDIQESINTFTDPPLAQSTIARKGHDKPLIDTGTMLRSPSYVVESGE